MPVCAQECACLSRCPHCIRLWEHRNLHLYLLVQGVYVRLVGIFHLSEDTEKEPCVLNLIFFFLSEFFRINTIPILHSPQRHGWKSCKEFWPDAFLIVRFHSISRWMECLIVIWMIWCLPCVFVFCIWKPCNLLWNACFSCHLTRNLKLFVTRLILVIPCLFGIDFYHLTFPCPFYCTNVDCICSKLAKCVEDIFGQIFVKPL